MAINILTYSLWFGAFISLICAVLVALKANRKHRKEIKALEEKVEELSN